MTTTDLNTMADFLGWTIDHPSMVVQRYVDRDGTTVMQCWKFKPEHSLDYCRYLIDEIVRRGNVWEECLCNYLYEYLREEDKAEGWRILFIFRLTPAQVTAAVLKTIDKMTN